MGVADAVAVSAVTGEGIGVAAPPAHPGHDRGPARRAPAPASRRSSTRCSARSARRPARSAPPTARPPHHGHARAAHAARRRAPDRHARDPHRRPLGRHGRDLHRRRRARAAVPLRRTAATTPSRAARSATSSTPSGSPPGASCSASWRGSRTAVPPPRRASSRAGDRPREPEALSGGSRGAAAPRCFMRAGEGNRTPIFGLGSQRLSHWTTPAEVGSVTDADTLADVRLRVFWPVTLAAAALVGLLAYGVVSKDTDTTLDDARGQGPAARGAAGRAAAARSTAPARWRTTRARSSC